MLHPSLLQIRHRVVPRERPRLSSALIVLLLHLSTLLHLPIQCSVSNLAINKVALIKDLRVQPERPGEPRLSVVLHSAPPLEQYPM